MRTFLLSLWLLLASAPALANPALHGTWSAVVNGQPMVVSFAAGGGGTVDGQPMRWQTMGPVLFIEQDGDVATYQFQVQKQQLSVSGGIFSGTVTFARGTAAAKSAKGAPGGPAAASGGGQELIGKVDLSEPVRERLFLWDVWRQRLAIVRCRALERQRQPIHGALAGRAGQYLHAGEAQPPEEPARSDAVP